MPIYEYNRDYPFAAFITNLGKYNEGELIGEWVKFPTTAEEIKAALDSIGIGQKDDFGYAYEEWFITDYDCYVDGLYDKLGEYVNLDELNYWMFRRGTETSAVSIWNVRRWAVASAMAAIASKKSPCATGF